MFLGASLGPSHGRQRFGQMAVKHRGLSVDLDDQPFMAHDGSSNSLHSNRSTSPAQTKQNKLPSGLQKQSPLEARNILSI